MTKITRVSSAIVEANFQWTYVRVYSDADGGLYGTGESFFAPGAQQIITEFSTVLVGEEPDNIEKLVEKMRWAASGTGSTGGIVWNAISGIEAALWDLKGKRHGLPVWQLLGGKFRDQARLCLDCHAAGALECLSPLLQPNLPRWDRTRVDHGMGRSEIITASAERAKQMAALGYTALKFDLDVPGTSFDSASGYALTSRDVDWMLELASVIREAVGSNVDLALDAHWRYRPHEILTVAQGLEPLRLLWLEDPCPPQDLAGLRYLRDHTSTPIGTGENLQLREGFWPLIADDLCSVVLPDLQKVGGLAEGRKIADMAATRNKPVGPHMIGGPLALMTSCQVAVTLPNFLVCEFHAHDVPFFHEIVQGGTAAWFSPGGVKPTDKPGFGLELDEKRARRWQLSGSKWFDS